jgi:hypothetical protein
MKIKKKFSRNKIILISVIAAIALLGGTVGAWYVLSGNQQLGVQPGSSDTSNGAPSAEDVESGQDAKKRESEQGPKTDPTDEDGKKKADVRISYVGIVDGNLEIRAFLNNLIEKGTCRANVTRGGVVISRSSTSFTDATTSICPPLIIPTEELSSGTWKVVVSYSSANAQGTSDTAEVNIP